MSDSENQNVSMNVEPEQNSNNKQVETKEVNINVNLLNNIKSILEISSARGTFKATELTAVGQVYDQLTKVLQ